LRNGEEEEEEEEEEEVVLSKGGHNATNSQKPSKKAQHLALWRHQKESKSSHLEGYSEGPKLFVIGCAREE
jgi:hypothetical protein